ncbi:DUF4372 domain-containing protein [Prevotella veroralis]|uniref:Uncharacterized protein n=1 Tax=Prevotella veroralis F0319 TaxID=649761 RepID=C9MQQ5_9BACT|nr:DUF4372 domain-containing protein [Prevotella veroralis]EEX18170.1 hypothetical protein HMPREF0973_01955 [Prevotella veroralis F0319]
MLFSVLKHFDSLREVEIGMKAEVYKLHHLVLKMLCAVVHLLREFGLRKFF